MDFNPLPPHGGRLGISLTQKLCKIFQSTPSAWRETSDAQERLDDISISIHSLRMEGDNDGCFAMFVPRDFNPLPPHGGRPILLYTSCVARYFNPLPPHGGRPVRIPAPAVGWYFNPLPPHGGRRNLSHSDTVTSKFQSTPSAWRETPENSAV